MAPPTNKGIPQKGVTGDSSIRARVSSPSPSIRNISKRRVNRERQPLLDEQHSHYLSTHDDNESIIYPGTYSSFNFDGDTSSESLVLGVRGRHNPGFSASDENQQEYTPTNTQNLEALEWSEILPYYLPCLSWIKSYNWSFFMGDLTGGLSLVFFQLPLSLSYATTLAHVPVISGLYSLGFAPLVYLIFGSVPQMIVGPEGPISLVVGQAVEPLLHHHKNKKELDPLEYVVAITFVSGASLLGFGLGRFGFLDNVLNASLLKGFISGIGVVMIINSLVVVLGLKELQDKVSNDPTQMDIHSPFDKLLFVLQNWRKMSMLSFKISLAGFILIMSLRILKKMSRNKKGKWAKNLVFVPEILIAVAALTWLCSKFRWDLEGLAIIGKVHNDEFGIKTYNPFNRRILKMMRGVGTSGFLAAMLGFFESTTASKSLGSTYDLPISSNRELVALGFINLVGSTFGALPAFGGYGRSKINALSAKTTMLGAIMGAITLFTVFNLLDFLYYVPECMLSVVTAVIGMSLIEEAPYELYFHWNSRGYNELITFGVTVTTTLFYSMEAGIAVGLIYSLIRVIKHSAQSRIQILGRLPGSNTFFDADIPVSSIVTIDPQQHIGHTIDPAENNISHALADRNKRYSQSELIQIASCEKIKKNQSKSYLDFLSDDHQTHLNIPALEEIEGCLIVKIPEPLTFTNSSDMRARLLRVEMYGSTKAHPALKRLRDQSMTKYIIFDLLGMTDLDSSAACIMKDLLESYIKRGIEVFFVRVHSSEKLRKRLFNTGVSNLLLECLLNVGYFDAQRKVNLQKPTGSTKIPDIEEAEIYNLIENYDTPYFKHIRDALKVIDQFDAKHPTNLTTFDFLEGEV